MSTRKLASLVFLLISLVTANYLLQNPLRFKSSAADDSAISFVAINPGEIIIPQFSLLPVYLSALAYDQYNQPIATGVTYDWGMSSIQSIGNLIPQGLLARFNPQNVGQGNIWVTATHATGQVTRSINVYVGYSPSPVPTYPPFPTATPIPTAAPTIPPQTTQIDVYIAGTSMNNAYPDVTLRINGVPQIKWADVGGGDPATRTFVRFTYIYPAILHPLDRVELVYTNDLNLPGLGDRNLMVDKITVNGVDYETEGPTILSKGGRTPQGSCASGNLRTEWLNCNGVFLYRL